MTLTMCSECVANVHCLHRAFDPPWCSHISSVTAILVSRFLLELQKANRAMVDMLDTDTDDVASFISSIGAFINPDLTAHSNEDYESRSHDEPQHLGELEGKGGP